jgi:hypothetical protein
MLIRSIFNIALVILKILIKICNPKEATMGKKNYASVPHSIMFHEKKYTNT